jgi:hypothetical protein
MEIATDLARKESVELSHRSNIGRRPLHRLPDMFTLRLSA